MILKGFKDSSETIKNYRDLVVWQKSYRLCLQVGDPSLLSGDLNFEDKKYLKALKDDIEKVEKMSKKHLKLLENKPLNPRTLFSN